MGYTSAKSHASRYHQINNYTGTTDANPHQLVLMLLEGALGKVAIVKGLMMRGETATKGEVLGQAVSIVGGLRTSLDLSAGGELAANLDNLYEYIERRLVKANLENDTTILDEVTGLLREVKEGWEVIPDQAKDVTMTLADAV